jgi:hypothetical protein
LNEGVMLAWAGLCKGPDVKQVSMDLASYPCYIPYVVVWECICDGTAAIADYQLFRWYKASNEGTTKLTTWSSIVIRCQDGWLPMLSCSANYEKYVSLALRTRKNGRGRLKVKMVRSRRSRGS